MMIRSDLKFFQGVILMILFLFSCSFGSKYPEAVLQGVEDRAIRTLRTDPLDRFVAGAAGQKLELRVVEVTLNNRSKERRAFLTFKDNRHEYLGRLEKLDPDSPLEFTLFEIKGSRFVAVWVDETAAKNPSFVTLGRPQQLPGDDSMSVLNTGEAVNRVALLYLPENETQLWHEITTIRVTGRGVTGYAWEKDFEPPLAIAPYFIEVNLP